MNIYLHNTLSGKDEEFKPLKSGEVFMYSCGPTVYSRPQLGNMRAFIFPDVLRRIFEYNGYKVTQVINITDIGEPADNDDLGEDKIEKAARLENKTPKEIAEKYTKSFLDDLDLFNVDRSKITFPKATDHVTEQIEMIKVLEEKGLTYLTSEGIYLDTSKIDDYGKLGQINIEGLIEGARVKINSEKKNPTDFVLWRLPLKTEKRHQSWDSPWGKGVPGWHIECSAMSRKYLGDTFDIHTGGIDLIPTHHNNEIAQSESVTGKTQANYWIHSSHVLINGEKISKSLGNGIYVEDLEEKNISPLAYRYWLLTADYKTLINFTWESVTASKTAYEKLINTLSNFPDNGKINEKYKEKFLRAVNNDLNTAMGIAIIWELLKQDSDEINDADKKASIFDFDKVLGLNLEAVSNLAKSVKEESQKIPESIQKLVEEREQARKDKDFKKADALREMIEEDGYALKDGENGSEASKVV